MTGKSCKNSRKNKVKPHNNNNNNDGDIHCGGVLKETNVCEQSRGSYISTLINHNHYHIFPQ